MDVGTHRQSGTWGVEKWPPCVFLLVELAGSVDRPLLATSMNPLSYKSSPQVQPRVVMMNSLVSQFRAWRLQLSGIPLRGLSLHIHGDLVRLPATPTLCCHFAMLSCHATQGCTTLLLTVLDNSENTSLFMVFGGLSLLSHWSCPACKKKPVQVKAAIDWPSLFYFTTL